MSSTPESNPNLESLPSHGLFSADDHKAMIRALELAAEAITLEEVPVGAVITQHGKIIAEAFNLRETLNDPTAHAERLVMTVAGQRLGSWRLDECTLYVTLEPCPMCAGAIVQSRLPRVVYGATDPKAGACESLYRIANDPRLNHRAEVIGGLYGSTAGKLLSDFFRARRSPSVRQNQSLEGCLSG